MHFHTHKHTHIYIYIHIHIHTDICRNRSSFRESAPKSRRSSSRWASSCLVAIFCQKRRSKETHIVSKPFWHITCCIILKIPLCCIPVRVLAPHAVKTNASKRPMLCHKSHIVCVKRDVFCITIALFCILVRVLASYAVRKDAWKRPVWCQKKFFTEIVYWLIDSPYSVIEDV